MTTIIREPEVNISLVSADTLVGVAAQRILCIGQKVAAGTATSGVLVTDIQNDNSWNTLFGENSMLAGIVRNARLYNTKTRIDAIPLSDHGSGVAAVGSFNISGTATEDGTLTLIVGSKYWHKYEIAVASGDVAAAIITDAIAAINADLKVPCTASDGTTKVDITADNDGTVGNSIGLKIEGSVAGITTTVTAMAAGATDPSFTTLFDVIVDQRYQTIVFPYSASIDTVKDFLDARWNVNNMVLDGVAVIAVDDSYANLSTLGNLHNSQSVVILGDEKVVASNYKGGAILEIPYNKAAQFSSIRGLRLTEDANLGQFVISRNATLDRFGGIALASLPYFNTPVPRLPVMDFDVGFTMDELDDLKDAGISVYGNNISGTDVILGEIVTTYKTDPAANVDVTFKFLNYVDTSSAIREYFFNNYKAQFAQCRLTEGALIAGRAMANPASIEAASTRFYNALANEALVQAGEAAMQFFKDNLVVTVDLAEGSATIQMKTPIVTQFRKIIATIQIAFTAES